jgi:hypothetical protein
MALAEEDYRGIARFAFTTQDANMSTRAQLCPRPLAQRLARAAIIISAAFTALCLLTGTVLATDPAVAYPFLGSPANSPTPSGAPVFASRPQALALNAIKVVIPSPTASPTPSLAPAPSTTLSPTPKSTPKVALKPAAKAIPKPAAKAIPKSAAKPVAPRVASTSALHGANHFWFPALAISQPVYAWPCAGGTLPDKVYTWGCKSVNNTYLLGHAGGVFAPLHDAYYSGRLRVGLLAYYSGADGKVHTYKVTEIRHLRVVDYKQWSSWALGPLAAPSLTLQTCDGVNNTWRIEVRLVQVH